MSPEKPQAIEEVNEAPPKQKLTKAEARLMGVQRMRALMKAAKLNGNPKDFVLATNNKHIADFERGVDVQSSFPAVIEPGNHVWHHDKNGRLRPVEVMRDEGTKVWVKNDVAEWPVDRTDIYPVGLPLRPTILHKAELRALVGDKVAGMFWNSRVRMRVSP